MALITGAGSGIGESTALLFAKEGAKLILTNVNEEKGTSVVRKIKDMGGEAIFLKADVSKPEDSKENS